MADVRPELDYTDLSNPFLTCGQDERSLVLRAINTERNNLVKWYAQKVDEVFDPINQRPLFYADKPWAFFGNKVSFENQVVCLNRFEARLNGCECCFSNADDFEHYHSPRCSPDFQEIQIIPDTTNVFARDAEANPNAL